MKKYILIFAAVTMMLSANAQIWKELGNAAKNAAKNAAVRQTERVTEGAIDRALEGAENAAVDATTNAINNRANTPRAEKEKTNGEKKTKKEQDWKCPACGAKGNTGKFCANCGAVQPAAKTAEGWTCEECGKEGNTGKFCEDCGAKKPGSEATTAPAAKATPTPKAETSYTKSDFVPGDEIFFDDPVENEKVGEYPSHWDFVGGEECEIITLNGQQVIKVQGWHTAITPLMKEANYLPEDFTIEFDVWSKDKNGESNNNWVDVVLLDEDGNEIVVTGVNPDYNSDEIEADFRADVGCSYSTPSDDRREASAPGKNLLPLIKPNTWLHIAISFNKRAYKYYVNGVRMINLPNVKRPTRMNLRSVSNEGPFYFKNIRIAKGAVPLYDRLASEGKIVTYAITFETGKADLKPESMVEINRIAKLMKENSNLSFEVQGHCDATGSDKINDPLSQKRAEAIVAELVKLDIAKSRLTAVGKGSHEPIASNATDEGRAKNRRVEFVKK